MPGADWQRRVNEAIYRDQGEQDFVDQLHDRLNGLEIVDGRPWRDVKTSINSELTEIETAITDLNADIAPNHLFSNIKLSAQNALDDLNDGEDPNGGGTTANAVDDLREVCDSATSPTYGGDALNDPLADVIKYVIDQQGIT